MKYKNIILFLGANLLIISFLLVFKSSNHVSKAQPCNLITNNDYIRVGISTADFSKLEYKSVSISSDGKFEITNKFDDSSVISSLGKEVFHISMKNNTFTISSAKKILAKGITGPLRIRTLDGSPLQVVNIKRKGKPAFYKGEIEIVKSPTKNNLLSTVNVISLEEYLKGVVPNELPTYFGLEALKAQAVAARNYAVRPRVKFYKQFDICDSVNCQVYYGTNTEEALSNKAVEDTKGLVALYNDEIILALYSSTAGGYTESYENAFSDPLTDKFPAESIPYLKGKPDILGIASLQDEENARKFYASVPSTFDVNSRYYRWNKEWTRKDLETVLNKNLAKYGSSNFVCPKFIKNNTIGTLKDIEVLERGVSGKAVAVKIWAANGDWVVRKELLIRKIFQNNGKILPSANVIFDKVYDEKGSIVKVNAFGGGFGHGVGMSQYGAGFMAKNGYTFDKILQRYYDGVSIGTAPVLLDSQNNTIRQEFASPNMKADLIICNYDKLDNLDININSTKLTLPLKRKDSILRFDLSKYVKDGTNQIVYHLPQQDKSVKAWIEVFIKNIN